MANNYTCKIWELKKNLTYDLIKMAVHKCYSVIVKTINDFVDKTWSLTFNILFPESEQDIYMIKYLYALISAWWELGE